MTTHDKRAIDDTSAISNRILVVSQSSDRDISRDADILECSSLAIEIAVLSSEDYIAVLILHFDGTDTQVLYHLVLGKDDVGYDEFDRLTQSPIMVIQISCRSRIIICSLDVRLDAGIAIAII